MNSRVLPFAKLHWWASRRCDTSCVSSSEWSHFVCWEKQRKTDVTESVPSTVGWGWIISSAGTSVHDGLAVTFGDGLSVRLLAHVLRAHARTHTRAAAGHHVVARVLTWTHGPTEHLRRDEADTEDQFTGKLKRMRERHFSQTVGLLGLCLKYINNVDKKCTVTSVWPLILIWIHKSNSSLF